MKTTKASAKRRTRRSRLTPIGLRALFDAMQGQDFRSFYGTTTPEAFLDVPRMLVWDERTPKAFKDALAQAAEREYPGGKWGPNGDQLASECADVAILAGFWSGVATCWYYMNAINGKDGGR